MNGIITKSEQRGRLQGQGAGNSTAGELVERGGVGWVDGWVGERGGARGIGGRGPGGREGRKETKTGN